MDHEEGGHARRLFRSFKSIVTWISEEVDEIRWSFLEDQSRNFSNQSLEQKDWNIKHLQRKLQKYEHNDPIRFMCLRALTSAFELRYDETESVEDLEQAIQYAHQLLEISNEAYLQEALEELIHGFLKRYERLGQITDLDVSLRYGERALQGLPTDPSRDSLRFLYPFSVGLRLRYILRNQTTDIEQSMLCAQQVLNAEPDGSSDRRVYLANLASTYCSLFSHSGQLSDIEAAIQYQQQAIVRRSVGNKSGAEYLSDLGKYFGFRYDKSRSTADLDQSLQFQLQALDEASRSGRIKPSLLYELASTFLRRYKCSNREDDLEQHICYAQDAFEASFVGDPNQQGYLQYVSAAYERRYYKIGEMADLKKSIHYIEQALDISSTDHPLRTYLLADLSSRLQARALLVGSHDDFAKAIITARDAVDTSSEGHPNRGYAFSVLALAYMQLFEKFDKDSDLHYSIEYFQSALSSSADDETRGLCYRVLGQALHHRFSRSRYLPDQRQSIKCIQTAVDIFPEDSPKRASALLSLGHAYRKLFQWSHQIKDLEQAILQYRSALVNLTDDYDHFMCIMRLADALNWQYGLIGKDVDAEEAMEHCQNALHTLDDLSLSHFSLNPSNQESRRKQLRMTSLKILGDILQNRSRYTQQSTFLRQAIQWFQQALDSAVSDDDRHNCFSSIGSSYSQLYHRSRSIEELERADNALKKPFRLGLLLFSVSEPHLL